MGTGVTDNSEGALVMNTDLQGKIRNTNLPKNKPLCPLFEAISNSIHAIEESGRDDGKIEVIIERDNSELDLGDDHAIKSIKIRDNGVGFNKDNFRSFRTAESTYKLDSGAKGIGRFVWLKAFDVVKIASTYKENKLFMNRTFDFLAAGDGIHRYTESVSDDKNLSTTVHLMEINERYRAICPKNLTKIAHDIVEHFVIYFLLKTNPSMVLSDESETIDLDEVYEKQIKPSADNIPFEVKGKRFILFLSKLYNAHMSKHQIHLCAHNREVKNYDLGKLIPELYTKIEDERGDYIYQAYVISEFLDENVNSERMDFAIDEEESLFDDVSKNEILDVATQKIREILRDYISKIDEEKNNKIRDHVNNNEPQFRAVVKHRPDLVEKIPHGLSKEELSIELYKIESVFVIENRKKFNKVLENDLDKIDEEKVVEQLNDVVKSDLAKYIVHRRLVLELLDRRLSTKSDNTNWQEDTIHELILPMRITSDDISFEQQNLWIIDERLSYHEYLASDKNLNQMEVLESESALRPDVAIFNRPFAFINDDIPYESIVIIEFKRPGRDDFTNKDNPIDQVVNYISEIRNGMKKDRRGQPIDIGGDKANTPFYAYIICSLSGKTREFINSRNFIETPDRYGYFYFHGVYNAYIEIISYQKLLKDAKERNRVLFDKLGIPMLINA